MSAVAVASAVPPGGMNDIHHSSSDLPPDNNMTTTWYGAASLPYNDPYIGSFSTSAQEGSPYTATTNDVPALPPLPPLQTEGSPWQTYSSRQSSHHDYMHGFSLPAPPHFLPSSAHNRPLSAINERPRSSPSCFGPSPDSINWPDPGLGLRYSTVPETHPSLSSTFAPSIYGPMVGSEIFASPSPPEIKAPQPRRQYPALAPNPAGVAAKRQRDDDENDDSSSRRRKRTCSVASADLSEDDRLLVTLKEDEGLPWKDIAARFGAQHGKTFQVAALQMRYKRLREKFRVWQGEDVEALKLAHEYWEKCKWDIISSKMLDFGITERWPSKHCARKWQKFSGNSSSQTPQPNGGTPQLGQYSSPAENGSHFAFMSMQ